jgi:hypothetical protein
VLLSYHVESFADLPSVDLTSVDRPFAAACSSPGYYPYSACLLLLEGSRSTLVHPSVSSCHSATAVDHLVDPLPAADLVVDSSFP